jgi:hypothetical protein
MGCVAPGEREIRGGWINFIRKSFAIFNFSKYYYCEAIREEKVTRVCGVNWLEAKCTLYFGWET